MIVTLVVDFEDGFALERIVTEFDPAPAKAQRDLIDLVKDADGAVLSDRAFDPRVEEFIKSLVTEFELAKVVGSVLEALLWTGANAAVLAGVVVSLDPDGEFGVELFEGVDAFFGKAQCGLES